MRALSIPILLEQIKYKQHRLFQVDALTFVNYYIRAHARKGLYSYSTILSVSVSLSLLKKYTTALVKAPIEVRGSKLMHTFLHAGPSISICVKTDHILCRYRFD